ncbi:MAG TPA: rhodanese-like domain-containing protein [Puia sp.]|jgi:phage shock protein E|nr:rhodanese-like domain-containing protein [Puia sp.]
MSWLSELFGGGGAIREALQQGAVVIDLRTAYEYDQGHIPRSLNIPVDRIKANIDRIRDLRKPVILCSGPSGGAWEAMDVLRNAGLTHVINGGNWQSLFRKMQQR